MPSYLTLCVDPTCQSLVSLVLLGDLHVTVLSLVVLEFLQPTVPGRQRAKSPLKADCFKPGDPFGRQGGGLALVLGPVVLALSIDPLSQSRVSFPFVGNIARAVLGPILRQLLKAFL